MSGHKVIIESVKLVNNRTNSVINVICPNELGLILEVDKEFVTIYRHLNSSTEKAIFSYFTCHTIIEVIYRLSTIK